MLKKHYEDLVNSLYPERILTLLFKHQVLIDRELERLQRKLDRKGPTYAAEDLLEVGLLFYLFEVNTNVYGWDVGWAGWFSFGSLRWKGIGFGDFYIFMNWWLLEWNRQKHRKQKCFSKTFHFGININSLFHKRDWGSQLTGKRKWIWNLSAGSQSSPRSWL